MVCLGWLFLTQARALANPAGAGGAAAKSTPTPQSNTWSVLVQPRMRWVLHDTFPETAARVVVVETYDVHQVAGAQVARLRWTAKETERAKARGKDKDGSDIGSQDGPCFTHLAVNPRGLYILRDEEGDTAIATQVQGKPSRSEPPRAYKGTQKNEGRYLSIYAQVDGPIICIGNGPEPGAGECDDVCFAEMCFSPTKGVVQISGTAAPDYGVYEQKGFKRE